MANNENKDTIAITVEYFKDIEDIWTEYFKTTYGETLIEMDIKMDNTSFPRNLRFKFITDKNVFSSIYYPPQFNIIREHQNYTKPEERTSDSAIVEVISDRDSVFSNRKCTSYYELSDEQIMEIGAYIEEMGPKAAKEKYNIHYPTCRKVLNAYQERLSSKETKEEIPLQETTISVVSEEIEASIVEDTVNGDSVAKISKRYKVDVEVVQQVIVDHWKFIENKKRIKKGKLVDSRLEEFSKQGQSQPKDKHSNSKSGNTIADQLGSSGMSVIDEFFANDKK